MAATFAQQTETDKFIDRMRKEYQVYDMNLSGGTIQVFAEQMDERLGVLAEKVTNVHFFAATDAPDDLQSELTRFRKRLGNRDFEPLTEIRSGKSMVYVYLREDNNLIKELIAVGRDDNDYFFAAATGNFDFSDLQHLKIIAEDLGGE